MTIRHLKAFVAVCENGSVTKAAESLHVAQPALSQTISDIEKYYNVALFNRINQRLVLTDTGKELLQKAKEVLESFQGFEDLATNAVDMPAVHIGMSLTIGTTDLPKIMRYIKNEYPFVKLSVTINNSLEIQQSILSGEIDFGIIEGNIVMPHFCCAEYKSDKLIIVCGRDFQIDSVIDVRKLASQPLLLREKGSSSREHLESIFKRNGISSEPIMESISNQAIIVAAKENFGVAVLPQALVAKDVQRGKLKEVKMLDYELKRTSFVFWHRNKKFGSTQKAILDYCCNAND